MPPTMTPTGVEHYHSQIVTQPALAVPPTMTPTGVEHNVRAAAVSAFSNVPPTMTPTGVEHKGSPEWKAWLERAADDDADRR